VPHQECGQAELICSIQLSPGRGDPADHFMPGVFECIPPTDTTVSSGAATLRNSCAIEVRLPSSPILNIVAGATRSCASIARSLGASLFPSRICHHSHNADNRGARWNARADKRAAAFGQNSGIRLFSIFGLQCFCLRTAPKNRVITRRLGLSAQNRYRFQMKRLRKHVHHVKFGQAITRCDE
jgi:hypothetical protein